MSSGNNLDELLLRQQQYLIQQQNHQRLLAMASAIQVAQNSQHLGLILPSCNFFFYLLT